MEELTGAIIEIAKFIVNSDPAIYRLIITDKQGLEIVNYSKKWNLDPNEIRAKNPVKNAVYPLLNSICNNSEKFLGFMRKDRNRPFIFTWNFEQAILFAASSPFGFVGIFCESDVNPGIVKKILLEKTIEYNQIVSSVFKE